MGIGKKAVKRKSKKVVESATKGIPVVGDTIDRKVKAGPKDRLGDKAGKTKDKLKRRR